MKLITQHVASYGGSTPGAEENKEKNAKTEGQPNEQPANGGQPATNNNAGQQPAQNNTNNK